MAAQQSFTIAEDSSVYYGGGYWNDLPQVRDYIESRSTGKPATRWFQHLKQVHGDKPFRKALFLNCGNGWVERDLLREGVCLEAVGTDISVELLEQARKEAAEHGLNARYYGGDINTAELPEGDYDLVVNFAAAHHIAHLDKVLRKVAEVLPEDGVFVSVDYVGPHRNQYGYEHWEAASALNASLPEQYRSSFSYPHLPTMLAGDPTEAIHSELILETVDRYFRLEELNPVGGGLAYLVLSHNAGLHADPEGAEQDRIIRDVLDADAAWTKDHDPLFVFFWGHPNKDVLTDQGRLDAWSREEEERERRAAANGGEYYPLSLLQQLTQEVETLKLHTSHMRADLHALGMSGPPGAPQAPSLKRTLVLTLDARAPQVARALRGVRRRVGKS
ncbi:MAG: class I SAM-dependent methyltransferase [Mycobacteriales bacterium]